MPEVFISAWQEIWKINEKNFSSKQRHIDHFEVYGERAQNINHAAIDIYIGIET